MHEFGIIQNIFKVIEDVAAKNQLRSVNKVVLRIGGLRQVVPEFLRFAFETISKGTIAENAELIITEVPIKVKCHACAKEYVVKQRIYVCPECNEGKCEVLSGKEIMVESIEGEKSGGN
jgi:hydrogenase nickel incorporation protein HypA/HybF